MDPNLFVTQMLTRIKLAFEIAVPLVFVVSLVVVGVRTWMIARFEQDMR